jgi:hypothetical protein
MDVSLTLDLERFVQEKVENRQLPEEQADAGHGLYVHDRLIQTTCVGEILR